MKFFSATSFLALVSLAGPTFAFDIGGGFSLTGNLEYERIQSGSEGSSMGILDADLVYQHSSGFGAFLGTQSISASGSSNETFYGGLTYSGDFGKVQIGAPRNALDDYVNAPAVAGIDFLDLQLGLFVGSALPVSLISSNDTAYGLRYDGSFGALDIGVSLHDVDGTRVYDAAMNYRLGETVLMAGGEHIESTGNSGSSFFLGAKHDFGQLTAGAIAGKSDLIGISVTSLRAFAVYSVNDRLDVTATVLNLNGDGPNGTLYGISANYDLNEMVYVEAGYMGSSGSSVMGGDLFTVGLGVTF